jgi:plastocyanin
MKLRALALGTALLLAGPGSGTVAAPTVHTVVIERMRFIPETLEVKPGDTIVWRNRDPFPHTATADAAGGPASPAIAAGGSWAFKAAKRGRYPYLCTLHRTMKAVLVVR